MNRKYWFTLLVICLATFGQAGSLGAVKFRCQQISEPNPNFHPIRINDKGQILGGISVPSVPPNYVHAAIWTPGIGAPQDLGTLGGNESIPADINEAGEVVGWSYTSSGAQHAFIWDQTRGIRDLGLLLGGNIASANSINNQGAAVGGSANADSPNNINRSVFWSSEGNIVDLGSTDSIPNFFINDYYLVAGSTWKLNEGGFEPILLLPMGSPVSLGLLPGDGDCRVAKMNNKGHMVGYSFPLWQNTPKHGCLWSYGNPPQDLGSLGVDETEPSDINDSDWIVGNSRHWGVTASDAFLHTPQDGMQDLNNLLVNPLQYPEHLVSAKCINNRGLIVCTSNYQIIYLLTPIKGIVPDLLLLLD